MGAIERSDTTKNGYWCGGEVKTEEGNRKIQKMVETGEAGGPE